MLYTGRTIRAAMDALRDFGRPDRIQLAVRSTIDENTDANVWRGRSRFNATFNDWRAFAAGGIASGNDLP